MSVHIDPLAWLVLAEIVVLTLVLTVAFWIEQWLRREWRIYQRAKRGGELDLTVLSRDDQ